MTKGEKVFNVVVSIAVILTGAGFGAFTGAAYSNGKLWWIGLIVGVAAAFPLAKFYLHQMAKAFAKDQKRMKTWFWGVFVAILCGLICTTITHGIMLALIYNPDESLLHQMDGFWLLFLSIGEAIGAGAGLIVGGICSLVYVLVIKGEHREIA